MTTKVEKPGEHVVRLETGEKKPARYRVAIVGAGTAGVTVAAKICKSIFKQDEVAIIDPSANHYYQPAWTLVGGGQYRHEATRKDQKSVIPKKAVWFQDKVSQFKPEQNCLVTGNDQVIEYEYLIVAAGIQINWDAIEGLADNIGKHGICSNYSFDTVGATWDNIRNFKGGTALFTQPATPIKCGGAPQKICYLAEHYFRKHKIRDKSKVIFATAKPNLFDVEKYCKVLERLVKEKDIDTMFQHDLVAIDAENKEALFKNLATGEQQSVGYDMIHVTPPMSAPEFIANSPLADQGGWVDVDKETLQHVRYNNVFSLGDCSNLPTSKTAAAIRKQAPVVAANLKSLVEGKTLAAKYNGYTSCPIVTGYGKLVLAEFDYDKNPSESFPFDQGKERWSMWLLKKYGLPALYWHGMLKGRA